MNAMASLVNLGGVCTCACSTGKFEGSYSLFRRVSYSRNFRAFPVIWVGKRWKYVAVCRYSVTTDYISDQGTSVSLDSTFRESSGSNDAGLVLKPAPKPQLQSGSRAETILEMGSLDLGGSKKSSDNGQDKNDEEDKSKVIESLGEVLEKAEKLETNNKVSVSINRSTKRVAVKNDGKPEIVLASSGKKSKTMKSVWRKGNPVTSVRKFEHPNQKPRSDGLGKVESQTVTPLVPPQPPLQVQPTLHAKPSASRRAIAKKPVVLKDVGAASKPMVGSSVKTKERKPILIDKFASKKPVVDPLVAQAVVAPRKPVFKDRAPGKPKDGKFYRKKETAATGQRKRPVDDVKFSDDEIQEIGVSIPGAATARKGRKWTKASRKAARVQAALDAAPVRVEILEVGEEGMLIEKLANKLAIGEGEIFSSLYSKGIKPDGMRTLNKDMVKMICQEYNVEVIDAVPSKWEEMAKKKEIIDEDDLDKLENRPPVLTIMGHVDHGKTTLLDFIRKSKVAAAEAGGITQGIGAYKVQIPIDGMAQTCVFLDTPGHEAFGAMRARGASVTDIAVIVVAADDGIRPQTREAIAHAQAAGVPIVIAINKIDKDGASPDRVMQELASIGLMSEDWGGDIPMVKISALKGENVDELLETIMLVAELQELKANPQRNAKGTVIEAGLEKSKGPVATFIVQNGTLRKGDIVVCGEAFGKVRALFDDNGKPVNVAGPSIPVQVMGLNNVPFAGDEFEVVDSLDLACEKASLRAEELRNKRLSAKSGDVMITLSSLASAVSAGKQTGLDLHQLNIILKVDVQGSIEAVKEALKVLPQDNVTLKFLLQATGDVSTSDVDLAMASKAIIFGFNVKVPGSVKSYAQKKSVEVRIYRVIYELIDDVRNEMEGLLDPVEERIPVGSAEVRAVFKSGSGQVAGCMVTEGKVVKDYGIRVMRGKKEVFVGVLNSLQRVKELVKEVNAGLECGIGAGDFNEWAEGDIIEVFQSVQRKRTLEEASAAMVAAVQKL